MGCRWNHLDGLILLTETKPLQAPSCVRLFQFKPIQLVLFQVTKEQLHYARMEVDAVDGVWELFAEDGEMRMYKREEEKDGLVVDPLKALHSVRGTIRHPT